MSSFYPRSHALKVLYPSLVVALFLAGNLRTKTFGAEISAEVIQTHRQKLAEARTFALAKDSAGGEAALVAMLMGIPAHLRHTLTQDNGSEHALHAELERVTGVKVYFCHPYSAWERGTVENRNGIIRRFFPKQTDFALVSDEELMRLEKRINSTPMVVLDFLTPDEAEEIELKCAA